MININIEFKDKDSFAKLIRYIENNLLYSEVQENIRILGHHCADNMKETINNERKNPARPDHKLENAIVAETLSTTGGVEIGIGRISTLIAQAPHFELINDGGTYITKETHVVPLSYFADISQFGSWKTYKEQPTEGFVTFKAGSSHVITGIDYVGKSIRNLDQELRTMMEKWGSKFLSGMGK